MTDEALMQEVSQDQLDSASELYERYSKRLYNYFLKISFDRDLGYDLMQNTFLRMIKYRHSYNSSRSFEPWIFQIARNVFADHLKSKKILTSDHIDVYQMDPEGSEGETESKTENERVLYLALSKLEPESREILILSRFENLKYEVIAGILNITVPTVKVKVHRAIKKLREYFSELEKI